MTKRRKKVDTGAYREEREEYDNCPLCKMMESGEEITKDKIRLAMKEAKKNGAIVGGPFFEDMDSGASDEEKKDDSNRPLTKDEYDLLKTVALAGEEGILIPEISGEKMPEWMDCAWRRVPCGKHTCPICGRVAKQREKHIKESKNPDSMEMVFEDVRTELEEALLIIKMDARQRGLDILNLDNIKEPPKALEFPLWRRVNKWGEEIFSFSKEAEKNGQFWLQTESAADFLWYSNTLMIKTYRQLCNSWHIEKNDGYGEFDHAYTAGVLKECLKILKESLAVLKRIYDGQSKSKENMFFVRARVALERMEPDILRI